MSNQLNDFGLKIFLDRYALKDTKKDTLAPGDTVVVCVNQKTRQREVGTVEELVDNPGNKPRVRIKLLDGSTVTQDWDDVDKPLETWPEQTMARVAGGIAAMETEEKREEWKEKFKWLLDDWRFVPGGRILSAAGTEQALTYFNCLAAETLVHLDTGVVEIGTLTGTHNVLSAGGVYRPAEFKSYGTQRLWCIEFENGEIVHATAEHEWVVLQSGEFCGNPWERLDFNAPRVHTRDLAGKLIPRNSKNQYVRVASVTETDRVEEVFCCVEMETHTITIGSGLLTGQCYVIPSPKDSRKGIVETLTNMMEIMSRGGGVGINLSSLRPQHAYVKGVNGRSSGSVSWGGLYSFVTGLIEQGGCFAPYTRILTDKGNIPVLEIVERMDKGEKFKAWTHVGWRKVTDKFRNGRKTVHRLTTELGYTLDITGEHKVMTMTDTGKFDLVKLDKLSAGDSVMILRGSVPNDIPYVKLNTDVLKDVQGQDVRLPEELDEDLAYALGYYVGNGCIAKLHGAQVNNVAFAVPHNRPETLEKLTSALTTLFQRYVRVADGDGAVSVVAVCSRQLVRYFNANGFTKEDGSLTARAPEQVFRSRRSVIEAFVGGWFAADGCNRGAKGGFGLDTVSYQGAMDLQKLLQMLGIVSRIATRTREAEGWNTIYRVVVSGAYMCAEMAKWLGDYTDKVADLPLPVKNHAYTWPVNFNSVYKSAFTPKFSRVMPPWNGTTSQAAIAHVRDNIELLTEEQAAHFQMLDNCVHDTISSIEKIGVMDTYDLTVDEVHTMSGDGIYVSNSRRGALMLMLDAWHPDLFKFIDAKREAGRITNANISIALPDAFMDAVKNDGDWELKFPDTNHPAYNTEWTGDLKAWVSKDYPVIVHETVKAKDIWDKIVASAWASAEPGLLFIDRVNAMSNSHYFSRLICTNPCGEQPLPEWGICNLGAINLSKHVTGTKVDWDTLKQTVRYAVRFLDNVIDATPYFIDENKIQQQRERRVGLGIMGLAEMMIRCEVRYGSKEGNAFIDSLGKFIAVEAYLASADYASEKGAFPEFDAKKLLQSGFMTNMPKNVRDAVKENGLRNVTLLTVAPTGTTGTMVDTSTGVEPYFAWTYWRKSRLGVNEIEVDIVADYKAKHPETKELPPWFVTAMDLSPEEHVRAQAALQRWIDSALSKTVNAPNNYTIDQTRELYELLYNLGCKGGTIYRDGSRDEQVLLTKKEEPAPAPVKVPEPKPRKRSNPIMTSLSARQMTALGSCYVNVTYDNQHEPLEVFVTSGKAGSDVASLAEGLGRVISMNLRLPSVTSPTERLAELAEQLNGIGGSDSVGFGKNKIKSLPDAVGKALEGICKQLRSLQNPGGEANAPEPEPEPAPAPAPKKAARKAPAADLCPACGQATYIREEGCRKCTSCGHSACG